jgi:DNA gyrase/topoisomerase IV subunit B
MKVTKKGSTRNRRRNPNDLNENEKAFFTIQAYEAWLQENLTNQGRSSGPKWDVKYYKGLGTSTNKEAKEYFTEFERHKIEFVCINQSDEDSILMVFGKGKVAPAHTHQKRLKSLASQKALAIKQAK